jgi:hypothetical protein
MKRAAATLAFALSVLGCGPSGAEVQQGVPVQLLTGDYQGMASGGGCFTYSATGQLSVDATSGTAIIDTNAGSTTTEPVMWRPSFTARRVGSEVVVLDPNGNVVAVTGRRYNIEGGHVPAGFFACGFVTQLP